MSFARHSVDFFKGISPALGFAVAAVSDPLSWAHALGFMTSTHWVIEQWARQSFFAACAFGWMWWWYLGVREQTERGMFKPDMPLHIACRWIARDSTWAEAYPKSQDSQWVVEVDDELMSKLLMGQIELFGRKREVGQSKGPMQHVTPNDKSLVQWESQKLVTPEPPTHMWVGGGVVYYGVMLDSRQVRRVWPRKSLWSRITRRSPVERIGDYSAIFAAQDSYYRDGLGFSPVPLAALAGPAA
jgi:hypothetical protein